MNGFAFCETDAKRQARQHRFRLPDITRCLVAHNISPKRCGSESHAQSLPDKLAEENSSSTARWLPSNLWSDLIKTTPRAQVKQNLLISALCWICYANALFCDFAFDDTSAIKENRDLRPETPFAQLWLNDFWGQPMAKEHSHKSYRPICVFTFRLNYALHQLHPFGYHLINVILHQAVCVLYLRFCRLIVSPKCSLLASILFSIHPIHTEAVTSVVGRAETLCAVFYLLALLTYSHATERRSSTKWIFCLLSIGCTLLAIFSKEQGITAIALCCVFEAICNQKLHQLQIGTLKVYIIKSGHNKISATKMSCPKWIKKMALRIAFLMIAALLMIAIRLRIMHSQLPIFTRFDNPAAYTNTPVRQMTHNYLFAVNAWLLLNPMNLCCDWTMGTIPPLETFTDVRNVATIAFYIAFAAIAWQAAAVRHHQPHDCAVLVISLALIVLPFLPASNLFFNVGFVVAERILYVPSFGFCLLVAYGMIKLHDRIKRACTIPTSSVIRIIRFALAALAATLIVAHCCRTILRNRDWRDELHLFTSGISVNPRNAKLYNNVGHVWEAEHSYSKALHFFLQATHIQPDDVGAHLNVGRTYNNLKKFELAELYFRRAKDLLLMPEAKRNERDSYFARIAPSHLSVFLHLANLISQNHSRQAEAELLYRQVIQMKPDYVESHINRAELLLKMNRTVEAKNAYKTALYYDRQNADIYYNLGVLAIEEGYLQQAINYFEDAIRLNSKHEQALLNFAIVVQDAEKFDLFPVAERHLNQLVNLGSRNERVYFHLGMISMNAKRHHDAERWFRKAIEIRADFRSATFNLALLLSNTDRALEAVPFLRQLVHHHSDHVKGLTLLCDILINQVKDTEQAENCYRKILKLQPHNLQAKHNLCVVYVEQGLLDEAEKCLLEATQMDGPRQDYIDRHLKIVRLRIFKMRQARRRL